MVIDELKHHNNGSKLSKKKKKKTQESQRDMEGKNLRGKKWIASGKLEKRRPVFL